MTVHTYPISTRLRTLSLVCLLAFATVFALITAISPVEAATITVNPGDSIQTAIDNATAGDTILISAGTYTESITLNKAVSLTGVSSDTTIINGPMNQRVISVAVGIDTSVVISGMTIQNGGRGTAPTDGGGIYLNGSPLLSHLKFISNTAQQIGGAIYAQNDLHLQFSYGQENRANNVGFAGTWSNLYLSHTHIVAPDNDSNTLWSFGNAYIESIALSNSLTGIYSNGDAQITNSLVQENFVGVEGNQNIHIINSEILTNVIGIYGNQDLHLISSTVRAQTGSGAFIKQDAYITNTYLISNSTSDSGGGVYAEGSIAIRDSHVISNIAQFGSGGGVYAAQTVTATNSQFENNYAGSIGGAIASKDGYIYSSTFSANRTALLSGAVDGSETLFIQDSIFSDNSSELFGGTVSSVKTQITNSLFENNSAASLGSVIASFELTLTNSVIRENHPTLTPDAFSSAVWISAGLISNTQFISNTGTFGAIVHDSFQMQHPRIDLSIVNSVFIGNYANNYGGAISELEELGPVRKPLSITNSIFANNKAGIDGDVLFSPHNQIELQHVTIGNSQSSLNSAIYLSGTAELTLTNSIVASYTTAVETIENATAHIDYSLFTSNNPFSGTNITTGNNNLTDTNPLFVDGFAGNYRLLSGSPAINAGIVNLVNTDIDGNPRPGSTSPIPDIGAYECDTATPPSNFTGSWTNGQISFMWSGSGTYQIWQQSAPYQMLMGNGSTLNSPSHQHQANTDSYFYIIAPLGQCGLTESSTQTELGYFNFDLEPGS